MITSIAANHAKGKSAQDKIFGANAAAVAAAAKYVADKVTNATIGAILDEDEKLVCLPTIEKVYRGLATNELIAYAPFPDCLIILKKLLLLLSALPGLKAISPLLLLPVVQALSIILSGTIWTQVKLR